jgi:hypothetical protein
MANDEHTHIYNQLLNVQGTYVYYVLGLTATALGFVVFQSAGEEQSLGRVLSGLSVASWALSMHCGLLYVKRKMSTLRNNFDYFEVKDRGTFNGNPVDAETQKKHLDAFQTENAKHRGKQTFYLNLQYRLLILGFMFFLAAYFTKSTPISSMPLNL